MFLKNGLITETYAEYDPVRNVVSYCKIQVVPSRRDNWFQRSVLFSSTRRALMAEVKSVLRADHENNIRERSHAISGMSDAADDLSESVFSVSTEYDIARKMVRSFDNRTLRMIVDAYGESKAKGAIYLLSGLKDAGETVIREYFSYYTLLHDMTPNEASAFLLDARIIILYKDLSELEGVNHQTVETIISLAKELRLALKQSAMAEVNYCRYAIKKLAVVALEYPDRTYDIARYTRERNLYPSQVDTTHLRNWLSTPSKSLGDGVL